MYDVSETITAQAIEKFGARIENGYILVPVDEWRRMVNQIFIGGMNRDVLHLTMKENQDAKR